MLGSTKRLLHLAGVSLFASAVALVCVGCAGQGEVSGRVTLNKKPVVFGTILVVGRDNLPRLGAILEDGTYVVKAVPTGQVRIAVNSPDPTTPRFSRTDSKGQPRPPAEEKQLAALKKKWFALPQKYGEVTTSGITLDVHRGKNEYDIELK